MSAAVLSSCAPAAPSANQLHATAEQIAATSVALTLDAWPTVTQQPSTTTTPTQQPSATNTETAQSLASNTSTFVAVDTLANNAATQISATDLADKSDKSTPVKLQNNTDQNIWLSIEGGGYWEYQFSDSLVILLPLGDYHYRAWIGDSGPYVGDFHIGNPDKHTLVFSNGKVTFQGP